MDSGVASAETFLDQAHPMPFLATFSQNTLFLAFITTLRFYVVLFFQLVYSLPLQEDLTGVIYHLMQSNLKCLAQNICFKKHNGWVVGVQLDKWLKNG